MYLDMKKKLSILLVTAMLVNMMAMLAVLVPAPVVAEASGGGFQGADSDAFSVLGFDTEVEPEGYNENHTENPFGTDLKPREQVWEYIDLQHDQYNLYGYNQTDPDAMSTGAYKGEDVGLELFQGVAGDFDGDGLPGELIYVGIEEKPIISAAAHDRELGDFSDVNASESVLMKIADPKTDNFPTSSITLASTTLNNSGYDFSYDARAAWYSKDGILGGWSVETDYALATSDYPWLNLLQIEAGDFDGDGRDEMAVYVPDSSMPRIDFYRYVGEDGDDWMNLSNWSVFWTRPLTKIGGKVPSAVSMAVGDMNRDGVEDIAISYSMSTYNPENYNSIHTASEALVLWGSRENALSTSQGIALSGGNIKSTLTRVGLAFDDIDSDGVGELLMAGSPIGDIESNTTRAMATYLFDGRTLVMNASFEYKVVDGNYKEEVVPDPDPPEGDPDATITVISWESVNGLDGEYLSKPYMVANVAAFRPTANSDAGTGETMLYVDSVLYKYTEGNISMLYALDDDNTNGHGEEWPQFKTNPGSFTGYPINNFGYVETGVVSANIHENVDKSGYDSLRVSLQGVGSHNGEPDNSTEMVTVEGKSSGDPLVIARQSYDKKGYTWNTGEENYDTSIHLRYDWADSDYTYPIAIDMDNDTTLIEYTGISYLTYSDPEVLAVVAAAPYFEDVERVTGNDYAWQNTTSWAQISSESEGDIFTIELDAGGFIDYSSTVLGAAFRTGGSLGFTYEYEQIMSQTEEYTLEFQTSANEDAVAFFSIPTQNYVYNIISADGSVERDIISIPFQPNYQILNLDYYESIQGDYAELPPIRGEAITSTPGDPASYPSSSSGLDVIAEWNDDPSGVSFGNGSQTQTITLTESEEKSHVFGTSIGFEIGGGTHVINAVASSEVSLTGGFQMSLNPAGGYVDIKVEGTEISGTVNNMPLEFQDYNYYYNWKLFSYAYETDDGQSIPIVSYIVNDVQAPPELPDDFQMDYDSSTSEKNVLTWTYPNSNSATFKIYRYYEFIVGGGLQEIAELSPETVKYTWQTDREGNRYKEYYFEDTEISPYSEYKYAIQVEEPYPQVPPLSSPSELVSVVSRSSSGYPNVVVAESDNVNDGNLLVYPDKNSYLTVQLTDPQGNSAANYYATIQYQWQKMENGAWVDIVNKNGSTLEFISAGNSVIGEYRCRINVITKADNIAITTYTDTISLTQSKRTTIMEDVSVTDVADGIVLKATVQNAHSDSAAIPQGIVTFFFEHRETGQQLFHPVELDSRGMVDEKIKTVMDPGLYDIRASYAGSYIFKPSESYAIYLTGDSSAYNLALPANPIYGDGAVINYSKVETAGGETKAEGVSAGSWTMEDDTGTDRAPEYITVGASLGEYILSPETPAGEYTIEMTTGEDVQTVEFEVLPRPVTLQIPNYTLSEDTGDIPELFLSEMSVVSGSWAPHWMEDETVFQDINIAGSLNFYDAAGNKSDTFIDAVKTSGAYIITRDSQQYENHQMTFVNSSLTVLGATFGLQAGAAQYGGTDVGTLYMMSPEYHETRNVLGSGINTSVAAGAKATFQAVPDDGYEIYGWFVDGVNQETTNSFFAITMPPAKAGVEVEVRFVVARNTLHYEVGGEEGGGTISAEPDFESGSTILKNAGYTFSAAANEGYHFKEWRHTENGNGTIYHDMEADTAEDAYTYTTDVTGAVMQSTYDFVMPDTSTSVVAVFERDYYTLNLVDRAGNDGLVAWYIGSTSSDSTAGGEKIYVTDGALIKGDTQVVVEAAAGYMMDTDTRFTSTGSVGVEDAAKGTYTLTLTKDTTVTGTTEHGTYMFSTETIVVNNVGSQIDTRSDGEITVTTNYAGEDKITILQPASQSGAIGYTDVPGGEDVAVDILYPHYYEFLGFTVTDTATTVEIDRPSIIQSGASVTKNASYKYYVGQEEYYFIASTTGIATFDVQTTSPNLGEVTIKIDSDSYLLTEISGNHTVTATFKELPQYTLTLESLAPNAGGSYAAGYNSDSYYPDGAYVDVVGDDHMVTFHEGDDILVAVVPDRNYTNTYWDITEVGGAQRKLPADSRQFVMDNLRSNYILIPEFASTIHHSVTWPGISNDSVGILLSEASGSVSLVQNGGSFSFKLSGNGVEYLESVYVNGYEFGASEVDTGSSKLTKTDETYTISDITSSQVITVSRSTAGITVNGVDISNLKGDGWSYDNLTAVLTISDNDKVIGGTWADATKNFRIVTTSSVSRIAIEDLNITNVIPVAWNTDAVNVFDFTAIGGDLTITVEGDNSVMFEPTSDITRTSPEQTVFGVTSAFLLDRRVTIDGEGTLDLKDVKLIEAINSMLELKENVRITALIQVGTGPERYFIEVDGLTIGESGDVNQNPSLIVAQNIAAGAAADSDTNTSVIKVTGNYDHVQGGHTIALYGGTFEAHINTLLTNWVLEGNSYGLVSGDAWLDTGDGADNNLYVDGGEFIMTHHIADEFLANDDHATQTRLIIAPIIYGGEGTVDISSNTYITPYSFLSDEQWQSMNLFGNYMVLPPFDINLTFSLDAMSGSDNEYAKLSYERKEGVDPYEATHPKDPQYEAVTEYIEGQAIGTGENITNKDVLYDLNTYEESVKEYVDNSTYRDHPDEYKYIKIEPISEIPDVKGLNVRISGDDIERYFVGFNMGVDTGTTQTYYVFDNSDTSNPYVIARTELEIQPGDVVVAQQLGTEVTLGKWIYSASIPNLEETTVDIYDYEIGGVTPKLIGVEVSRNLVNSLTLNNAHLKSLDLDTLHEVTIEGDNLIESEAGAATLTVVDGDDTDDIAELIVKGVFENDISDTLTLEASGTDGVALLIVGKTVTDPESWDGRVFLQDVEEFTLLTDGVAVTEQRQSYIGTVLTSGDMTVQYLHKYESSEDYALGVYGHSYTQLAGERRSIATAAASEVMANNAFVSFTPTVVEAQTADADAGLVYDMDGVGNVADSVSTVLDLDILYPVEFDILSSEYTVPEVSKVSIDKTQLEATDYSLSYITDGKPTGTMDVYNVAARFSLFSAEGTALHGLEHGEYSVTILFASGDTVVIPLTVKKIPQGEGALSISGDDVVLRGDSLELSTAWNSLSKEPGHYDWEFSWVDTNNMGTLPVLAANGGSTASITGSDLGEVIVKVTAYESDGGTYLDEAYHNFTIYPEMESIEASIVGWTPNSYGDYSIVQHLTDTNTELSLSTVVTMATGSDMTEFNGADEIVWEVNNATRLQTSVTVDPITGAATLTVDTAETGVDDRISVKVTYRHVPSGQSVSDEFYVYLSTDAQVSYSNTGATGGLITGVTYSNNESITSADTIKLVPEGNTVTVQATPEGDNKVETWFVNGLSVMTNSAYTVDETNNTLKFNVASRGKYVVTADYVNKFAYAVNFTSPANGAVTATVGTPPVAVISGEQHVKGTSVTLTATPDAGYGVDYWTVNGSRYTAGGSNDSITLTVDKEYAVSVTLKAADKTVSVIAIGEGDVQFMVNNALATATVDRTGVDPVYSLNVMTGDEVVIYAIPDVHKKVESWLQNSVLVQGSEEQEAMSFSVGVTALDYTVTFGDVDKFDVTVSIESDSSSVNAGVVKYKNDTYTRVQNGMISVYDGESVTLLASPDVGMMVDRWIVRGEGSETVTYSESEDGNAVTITGITQNVYVTARFTPIEYAVNFSSSANGSLTAAYTYGSVPTALSNGDGVRAGLKVTFTTAASADYHLHSLVVNEVDVTADVIGGNYVIDAIDNEVTAVAVYMSNDKYAVTAPDDFATDGEGKGTVTIAIRPEDTLSTVNGKVASIVMGGTALITFNPETGNAVDAQALLAVLMNIAGNDADVSLELEANSKNLIAVISNVQAALDFSGMANPFVESTANFVSVGTGSGIGGVMRVMAGGVVVNNMSEVPEGTEIMITLVADSGYELTTLVDGNGNNIPFQLLENNPVNPNISGSVMSIANSGAKTYTATVTANAAMVIDPTFRVSGYNVTINVIGTGMGSVSATNGTQTVELRNVATGDTTGTLPVGSNVTITATANAGISELDTIIVTHAGSDIPVANGAATVDNLGGDLVVTVVFNALEKEVTVSKSGEGALRVIDIGNNNEIVTSESVAVGTKLLLIATPEANSALESITAGGSAIGIAASGGSGIYEVDASKQNSIVANFTQSMARVTWSSPTGVAVTVTNASGAAIANGSDVRIGDTISISASPSNALYRVTGTSVNGTQIVQGGSATYTVQGETVISFTVDSDVETQKPHLVILSAGGTVEVSDATGATVPESASLNVGDVLTFTATADSGYTLSSIKVKGIEIANGETYTVQQGDTAITVVVTFASNAVGGGGGAGGVIIEGEYSIKLRTEGDATLTVTKDGEPVEDGDMVQGGDVLTIAATTSNADRDARIVVNGHPFVSGNTYEVYANTEILATDMVEVGLPYYMSGDTKVFLGFAADVDADGYIEESEYVAPKGKDIMYAENGKNFTDISGHWGEEYIDFVTERELFLGTSESMFSPDMEMTRAMFATVIGRLHERSYGEIQSTGTNVFTDCDYTLYYGKYVDWAAESGIIKGIGDNMFAPDNSITREEMAVILYRYASFLKELPETSDTTLMYTDKTEISDWATDAALFTQTTGIITGVGENRFEAKELATRAEVATIIERFVEYALS